MQFLKAALRISLIRFPAFLAKWIWVLFAVSLGTFMIETEFRLFGCVDAGEFSQFGGLVCRGEAWYMPSVSFVIDFWTVVVLMASISLMPILKDFDVLFHLPALLFMMPGMIFWFGTIFLLVFSLRGLWRAIVVRRG